MQSKFVQVIVCRSDHSLQDKRLSEGLVSRLNWLTQRGMVVGGSGLIIPGQNVLEEMIKALLSSRVAILLMSIDWLLDPLMQTLEPLLLERANSGELHVLPVLLRPFPSFSSTFAHIAPINRKFVGDMTSMEREKIWESVLSQVLEVLGMQLVPPSLQSVLTEQYLHGLLAQLAKNTGLKVSLFTTFAGKGTLLTHGLGLTPDRVLFAGRDGQEISADDVGSTTLRLTTTKAGSFTGLAIARKE